MLGDDGRDWTKHLKAKHFFLKASSLVTGPLQDPPLGDLPATATMPAAAAAAAVQPHVRLHLSGVCCNHVAQQRRSAKFGRLLRIMCTAMELSPLSVEIGCVWRQMCLLP
jgi:hypothetical protein